MVSKLSKKMDDEINNFLYNTSTGHVVQIITKILLVLLVITYIVTTTIILVSELNPDATKEFIFSGFKVCTIGLTFFMIIMTALGWSSINESQEMFELKQELKQLKGKKK